MIDEFNRYFRDIDMIINMRYKPSDNVFPPWQKFFSDDGFHNTAFSTALIAYNNDPWKVESVAVTQATAFRHILKFC